MFGFLKNTCINHYHVDTTDNKHITQSKLLLSFAALTVRPNPSINAQHSPTTCKLIMHTAQFFRLAQFSTILYSHFDTGAGQRRFEECDILSFYNVLYDSIDDIRPYERHFCEKMFFRSTPLRTVRIKVFLPLQPV